MVVLGVYVAFLGSFWTIDLVWESLNHLDAYLLWYPFILL
jgi:hypothetical protein